MAEITIHRVNSVPAGPTYTGSAFYIVKGAAAGEAEVYFTNTAGTEIRSVITHAEVDTKISNALAAYSSMEAVADITARDALTLTANTMVLVADASADATVTSGAAMYFWDETGSSWTKIYEFEGMDLVLSWANLSGKPSSSVAAIDQAVTDSHTHANATVLDGISEDGTTNNLVYNGIELSGNPLLVTDEW